MAIGQMKDSSYNSHLNLNISVKDGHFKAEKSQFFDIAVSLQFLLVQGSSFDFN